jgi:hypothetical protein
MWLGLFPHQPSPSIYIIIHNGREVGEVSDMFSNVNQVPEGTSGFVDGN